MTFRTRRAALVAAAALLAATAPAASADPEHSGREGVPCVFAEVPMNGNALAGRSTTGLLSGGPFAGDGTVTCSLQYDASAHSAPDAAVASASGREVVHLAPTPVWAKRAGAAVRIVCTKWTPADGSPVLYLTANDWTVDADAPCSTSSPARLFGSAFGRVESPPAPPAPPRPVYPSGTITLTQQIGGFGVHRVFDPPFQQWSCDFAGYAVSCTPPAPEPGTYHVCGSVSVLVRNEGVGTVTGVAGCGSGPTATATAGPLATSHGHARPRTAFPVTCAAEPDALALRWSVQCSFGA